MPNCLRVSFSSDSTCSGRWLEFQSFEVMKSSSRLTTEGMTFFRARPTYTLSPGEHIIVKWWEITYLILILINHGEIKMPIAIPHSNLDLERIPINCSTTTGCLYRRHVLRSQLR